MNRSYLIVLFAIFTFWVSAQNLPYPKVVIDGQEFYNYEVKPGEGLFSVSRIFELPIDQILKYNPSAKDGLMNGQKLNIPIPPSKQKLVLVYELISDIEDDNNLELGMIEDLVFDDVIKEFQKIMLEEDDINIEINED